MLSLLFVVLFSIHFSCLFCKPFHIYNNAIEFKYASNNSGNYQHKFNSQFRRIEDDIGAEANGTVGKTKDGEEVVRVDGKFHFAPVCDHLVTVRYTADENGYRPHVEQFFNRQVQKEGGKIVGYTRVCPVVQRLQVGAACIASLQGGCVGK